MILQWPFIRFLGVQEPASMVFSALNGLSHIVMLRYFRAHVSADAPLYYLWHFYAVVSLLCDISLLTTLLVHIKLSVCRQNCDCKTKLRLTLIFGMLLHFDTV